ncbi:hypothetical protein M409DRAFT_56939 [Zasmidium cellare ATCC 36951]|uniref:Uncharacterized protein n=1 Tax=Zasmidium cellare ATCC 36951 TaxID=1080233 RepID=A0A6A6CEA0_ZASCE|nr:uncharacterized protein M409DRAFT_56939 [Zasmidium cellare ATCC 36951]KAF2164252.1 hypothetical protein M409DRAFT_56939 [Zasmidium cellare ATCC 36951]
MASDCSKYLSNLELGPLLAKLLPELASTYRKEGLYLRCLAKLMGFVLKLQNPTPEAGIGFHQSQDAAREHIVASLVVVESFGQPIVYARHEYYARKRQPAFNQQAQANVLEAVPEADIIAVDVTENFEIASVIDRLLRPPARHAVIVNDFFTR